MLVAGGQKDNIQLTPTSNGVYTQNSLISGHLGKTPTSFEIQKVSGNKLTIKDIATNKVYETKKP